MLIIDIILLIIILGFFIGGWQRGLIKTLAGLVGLVVGIILASHYYPQVADWLMSYTFFDTKENLANIISFAFIFFIVNGLVGVGAFIVDKTFNILSFIPFLKTINRLAGAILNLVTGIILLGILIVVLVKFPVFAFVNPYLERSEIAPYLILIIKLLSPLWPEFINQATGLAEKVIQNIPE